MIMKFIWYNQVHETEGYFVIEGKSKESCLDQANDLLDSYDVHLVNWYEI